MCNKGLEASPLYGAANILLHSPLGDIPEDAHAVVTQNGIGVDIMEGRAGKGAAIRCDQQMWAW